MKKLIIIAIMVVVFLPLTVNADDPFTNFDEFAEMVRKYTRIKDKSIMPDTTLWDICAQSIVWVSTEVGGCELRYRFVTVANQAFYQIPDSITEIVHATVQTKYGETKAIRAYYPEYFADFGVHKLSDANQSGVPIAYFHWDDTLQILPPPIRVDTVYLYAFTRHVYPDTSAALDTITFNKTTYAKAAISYACMEVLMAMKDYQSAGNWAALYEKQVATLRQTFSRKMQRPAKE